MLLYGFVLAFSDVIITLPLSMFIFTFIGILLVVTVGDASEWDEGASLEEEFGIVIVILVLDIILIFGSGMVHGVAFSVIVMLLYPVFIVAALLFVDGYNYKQEYKIKYRNKKEEIGNLKKQLWDYNSRLKNCERLLHNARMKVMSEVQRRVDMSEELKEKKALIEEMSAKIAELENTIKAGEEKDDREV